MTEDRKQSPYAPPGASPRPWHAGGGVLFRATAPAIGGPDPQPSDGEAFGEFDDVPDAKLTALAVSNYEEACRLLEGVTVSLTVLLGGHHAVPADSQACTQAQAFLKSAREQAGGPQ
mgnify:CR=1 FL=1